MLINKLEKCGGEGYCKRTTLTFLANTGFAKILEVFLWVGFLGFWFFFFFFKLDGSLV